jgi:hypothetical protein
MAGITLRGDARADIALAGIEEELSELTTDGRRIDLRTPAELSRHFRADVMAAAAVQYAA